MKKTTITATIKGGNQLTGEITIVPNKNAVLPAIAASILTDGQMEYHNLPYSPDVEKMLKTLSKMGAAVDDLSATISICCKNISTHIVPSDDINDMQAGYLLAGPLLARFGKASIPLSSGCRLGYRGFEDHAEYFKKLGVRFSVMENYVHFELIESIKDERITVKDNAMYEERSVLYSSPFVTPTENILMLLSGSSRFNTKVSGIAQEPHIAQLIELLKKMGANIKGSGSCLWVAGKDILSGATFTAEPDHVSYFGFAVTAAMTKSDITLCVPTPLPEGIIHMNEFLEKTGVKLELVKNGVKIFGSQSAFTPNETFPKFDTDVFKVNHGPWPMFPVDCLPSMLAWSSMNANPLTSTRLNNWLYSDGLKYVPVLREMGAKIGSFDDQRATVQGTLNGNPYNISADITAPDVIEGCRAVISCALAGKGTYEIKNVQYIMRREPNFFETLKHCGADIEITHFEETT